MVYLIFQLGMILVAKFSDNRYFTWAPHDIQTSYKLSVVEDGQELTNDQLQNQFGLYYESVEDLPANHLFERVTEYYRLNPNRRLQKAVFQYSINGLRWKEMKVGEEVVNE